MKKLLFILLFLTSQAYAQKVTIDTQNNVIKITPADKVFTLDDQKKFLDDDKEKVKQLTASFNYIQGKRQEAQDKMDQDQADYDSYKAAGLKLSSELIVSVNQVAP